MTKTQTQQETVLGLAHARGSTATTRPGAWRYLLGRVAQVRSLPIPDVDALQTARHPWRGHRATSRRPYRTGSSKERLAARWSGWRDRHAALSRALDRAKKAEARRDRIAQIAKDDRALLAAGYSLAVSADRLHRVLSGMDDGHPFTVEVPLRVLGIAEALEWLRPDGVRHDTPRQGEWYFVLADEPDITDGWEQQGAVTDAGSYRERRVYDSATFDRHRRHMPTDCRVVEERGETAFIGRRAVETHPWRGRPRVYVSGGVDHPEHGTLVLPGWHEVVPNRAHGPFTVGEPLGGLD